MGALISITPSRMGHILPPSMRSPRRILDCGCGPGDWAIEVATQYPDAEVSFPYAIGKSPLQGAMFSLRHLDPVGSCGPILDPRGGDFGYTHGQRGQPDSIPKPSRQGSGMRYFVAKSFAQVLGIDVSPHMIPENPPDNMELQVDDLNGRFTFRSNHFDVVHSQMVAGGIHANRWRSYIRDIFRVLKPGGWCQMVEIYFNAQSDNALYPFTQFLGMSFSDFQLLIAQARSEASNPAFKAYFPV
ncbi:methyltransferase [Fusarium sp. NRRL 25303]|nr:methyltransferase [Fusarium sp. NRRL 25303]